MEFEAPAAFLITGGLPHAIASTGTMSGWLVQFLPKNLGSLEGRPEAAALAELIADARRGVRFSSEAAVAADRLLGALETQTGLSLWLKVVGLLDELSHDKDRRVCSYAAGVGLDFPTAMDDFDTVVSALFDEAEETHSLSEASRRAGMPVSTFCRTFKRRVGLTFVEYLHSIRINTAKKLLIQTNLCVDDICYECGFNNVSFFDRKFKQLTGMTPTKYRKTYLVS